MNLASYADPVRSEQRKATVCCLSVVCPIFFIAIVLYDRDVLSLTINTFLRFYFTIR